jgi:hypothetical protein
MVLPQAGQAWPNQVKFGCLEYQFLRCKSRVIGKHLGAQPPFQRNYFTTNADRDGLLQFDLLSA